MFRNLFTPIFGLIAVLSTAVTLFAVEAGGKTEQPLDPQKAIFKEADVNGDGFITWEEANKASSKYQRDLYKQEIFKLADLDRNSNLSAEEVSIYLATEASKQGKKEKGAEGPTGGGVAPQK